MHVSWREAGRAHHAFEHLSRIAHCGASECQTPTRACVLWHMHRRACASGIWIGGFGKRGETRKRNAGRGVKHLRVRAETKEVTLASRRTCIGSSFSRCSKLRGVSQNAPQKRIGRLGGASSVSLRHAGRTNIRRNHRNEAPISNELVVPMLGCVPEETRAPEFGPVTSRNAPRTRKMFLSVFPRKTSVSGFLAPSSTRSPQWNMMLCLWNEFPSSMQHWVNGAATLLEAMSIGRPIPNPSNGDGQ